MHQLHTDFSLSMTTPQSALALERLYSLAEQFPNDVCMTQPMGQGVITHYTWADVLDQTSKMASHLMSLGLDKDTKIGILSKNTAHWLMADWAIWMAGFISVPLYPTSSSSSIQQILEHSDTQLLFVGKLDNWDLIKGAIPASVACIDLPLAPKTDHITWDSIVAFTNPLDKRVSRRAEEVCTLIYTSGTTGISKGVMHTFNTFAFSVEQGLKRVPLFKTDRILSYLPLSHIAERVMVEHVMLKTGAHIFFAESVETFLADLQRARPTFFFSVPRLWIKFKDNIVQKIPEKKLSLLLSLPIIGGFIKKKILKALGLDQTRIVASGAAPLPTQLVTWYQELGLSIIELYGMTENCGLSHSTDPHAIRPGTVGLPHSMVESRIDAASGEIQMRGQCLMQGYYKDSEQTHAAFTNDGWLHTGDQGHLDTLGNLVITGRLKDLFKTSKGKYVVPAPIEEKLAVIEGVEACCVVGAFQNMPVGILSLSPERLKYCDNSSHKAQYECILLEKLNHINQGLDAHERLSTLICLTTSWTIEDGFLTPTLKVKRNVIDQIYSPKYPEWCALKNQIVWF
jgi:long-chain acyl-CoA synthetase